MNLSPEAVAYAWRELARRAGVTANRSGPTGFEDLGIPVHYARPENVPDNGPAVIVVPCRPDAGRALLRMTPGALDSVEPYGAAPEGARLEGQVPVLFWGDPRSGTAFASLQSDRLVFHADILAATVFLLSRWEEMVSPERDEHGRFPATASVAMRQGFLDRPVVDEYALVLRSWLQRLWPGWTPRRRPFEVKLSHDVDVLWAFGSLANAARIAVGDLVKRRRPSRAVATVRNALAQSSDPRRSVHFRGIERLADISRRYGFKSAFYFMAARRSFKDSGYRPEAPAVRKCIGGLRHQGFELGFHPSYRAFENRGLFAWEKARMDRCLGETRYGGRQHYLRFRVPETWRQWEECGLAYDSTLCFADWEGFRCGTCHPYRPFDLERNREIGVSEIPLVVMDDTLRLYRHLTPEAGEAVALKLAERCRAVEGTFTLLWHNSSLDGEWEDWGAAYERLVAGLSSLVRESGRPSVGPVAGTRPSGAERLGARVFESGLEW